MSVQMQPTTNFSATNLQNSIGVLPTPPARTNWVNQDTLEIIKAKAPEDIKNAGTKKIKAVNIVNFLWLGVASICSAVAIKDLFKLFKK